MMAWWVSERCLDGRTSTSRGRRNLVVVWSVAFVLLGCGTSVRRGPSTVVIAYPQMLDPLNDAPAEFLVFLPLVKHNEDGELEGRLAERWEFSAGHRECTLHLHRDFRWHDGMPVTAHDIKFSMELVTHPDVLEEDVGHFGTVTVIDDWTLKVRDGYSVLDTDVVFYPKHKLEHLDPKEFYNWDFWNHPVGNGPYRWVRTVPQTMMEFGANADYYRGKPKIERVILKFVGKGPNGDAALSELTSGNVDAITDANAANFAKLARDPRIRAYQSHVHWWIQIAMYWQRDHVLFHDQRVRQALAHAIDREELQRVLHLPENTPIVDGPYTLRQLRRREFPEAIPFDPDKAQSLLEAAGWKDRDGDGVRDRDGQIFRFTVLVGDFSSSHEAAVYVQSQLRKIGVEMNIKTQPNLTVFKVMETGDFEAVLTAFTPGVFRRSRLGPSDAELEQLIDRLDVLENPDEDDRLHRELYSIFRSDVPVTILFPHMKTTLAHRRIRGMSTPWRAHPIFCMEDLWLEDDE